MMTCVLFCLPTKSKHAESVVFYVALEALKRLPEHLRTLPQELNKFYFLIYHINDCCANVKPIVIREIVKSTRNWTPPFSSLLNCSCLFTRGDLGSNLLLNAGKVIQGTSDFKSFHGWHVPGPHQKAQVFGARENLQPASPWNMTSLMKQFQHLHVFSSVLQTSLISCTFFTALSTLEPND